MLASKPISEPILGLPKSNPPAAPAAVPAIFLVKDWDPGLNASAV